jgi:K+-sensing histidine kinase KdpD
MISIIFHVISYISYFLWVPKVPSDDNLDPGYQKMGIKKDEMQHIWDRLYRGNERLSVPGLGLGLSLVRAIVQAHGGSIELRSTPRRGSKFIVFISLNM